jgi:hypothetical protein
MTAALLCRVWCEVANGSLCKKLKANRRNVTITYYVTASPSIYSTKADSRSKMARSTCKKWPDPHENGLIAFRNKIKWPDRTMKNIQINTCR